MRSDPRKPMPRLDSLLSKRSAGRRQTWQEQMAVMDMWVAATNRRERQKKGTG